MLVDTLDVILLRADPKTGKNSLLCRSNALFAFAPRGASKLTQASEPRAAFWTTLIDFSLREKTTLTALSHDSSRSIDDIRKSRSRRPAPGGWDQLLSRALLSRRRFTLCANKFNFSEFFFRLTSPRLDKRCRPPASALALFIFFRSHSRSATTLITSNSRLRIALESNPRENKQKDKRN